MLQETLGGVSQAAILTTFKCIKYIFIAVQPLLSSISGTLFILQHWNSEPVQQ